jgi:hypothetical protein
LILRFLDNLYILRFDIDCIIWRVFTRQMAFVLYFPPFGVPECLPYSDVRNTGNLLCHFLALPPASFFRSIMSRRYRIGATCIKAIVTHHVTFSEKQTPSGPLILSTYYASTFVSGTPNRHVHGNA